MPWHAPQPGDVRHGLDVEDQDRRHRLERVTPGTRRSTDSGRRDRRRRTRSSRPSTSRAMRSATTHAPPAEMPAKMPSSRREPARHRLGFGLRHGLDPVDAPAVEDLRQIGLRPLADSGNLRALLRLRADDHDRRILLLQKARHAHDRAGRAHRRDEVRDRPAGVAPDLGTRSAVVRERIVGIRELVEDDALALVAHLLREVARVLHAAGLRRQHELGAVRAHRLPTLERQVVRHHEDHPVALHRRDHRQRDAGVAGRGLDQRVAGPDVAALLGLDDHRQRRAVLDRARGIVAFELAEDDVRRLARNPQQADERRVADGGFERGVHCGIGSRHDHCNGAACSALRHPSCRDEPSPGRGAPRRDRRRRPARTRTPPRGRGPSIAGCGRYFLALPSSPCARRPCPSRLRSAAALSFAAFASASALSFAAFSSAAALSFAAFSSFAALSFAAFSSFAALSLAAFSSLAALSLAPSLHRRAVGAAAAGTVLRGLLLRRPCPSFFAAAGAVVAAAAFAARPLRALAGAAGCLGRFRRRRCRGGRRCGAGASGAAAFIGGSGLAVVAGTAVATRNRDQCP